MQGVSPGHYWDETHGSIRRGACTSEAGDKRELFTRIIPRVWLDGSWSDLLFKGKFRSTMDIEMLVVCELYVNKPSRVI